MTTVCKNCDKIVIPHKDDGHCPNCGSKVGYTVRKTTILKHRIEDERDEIKRAIDKKFHEFDYFIQKGKNVEFYSTIKKSLERQVPKFLKQVENDVKERLELEEKEREQHKISFTIDAVIRTEEQRKIKEQEDYIVKIKNENDQLRAKVNADKLISSETTKILENISTKTDTIHDRLSHKSTILLSLIIGVAASFVGSLIYSQIFTIK